MTENTLNRTNNRQNLSHSQIQKKKNQLNINYDYSHFLLQMNTNTQKFDWERLPFYTILEILWHLTPRDIESITQVIPYMHRTYEYINESNAFKFILYPNDDRQKLIKCKKLRFIQTNLQNLTHIQAIERLLFISEKKGLNQLHMADDLHIARRFTRTIFINKLKYLTTLAITSKPRNGIMHNICSILQKSPNLKRLYYAYGNLYTECIRSFTQIEELKLKSVYIHDLEEFADFLQKNGKKLKTLHCYNDPMTTIGLNLHLTNTIYNQLIYLKNLEYLKIMAINNTHKYENLETPTYLRELIILTKQNSYLPNLYQTLTYIITEKTQIHEWLFPNIFNECVQVEKEEKIKSLKRILNNQEETKLLYLNPIKRTAYSAVSK